MRPCASSATWCRTNFGDVEPGDRRPPKTPEEAETRRFLSAQYVARAACPKPADCHHDHCRRDRERRHLARIRARWSARKSSHPQRPPGAEALRHAIWVYVSARRAAGS
jgi:hypothetical protein